MNTIEQKPIGEIVAEDYRTAFIFKNFGIEYCCGGKKSLAQACASRSVDLEEVLKQIESATQHRPEENRFNEWSASFLIDYIINNHHVYVKEKLPFLMFLAGKVARVHGYEHPELIKMNRLVQELNSEMMNHMSKEEGSSFPLIKKLETNGKIEEKNDLLIAELEDEHEAAGAIMEELRSLSNQFQFPEGACSSYQIYFKTLNEFEEDLHKHVHLENNVLFTKVEQLLQAE
ncbi:MAG: iron-sulfur cluster repair di-iron protein [Balneolaceae bacterium]|nr:iron-sulfur cluster repair di-iron protein [Balneolaceae bacterium]